MVFEIGTIQFDGIGIRHNSNRWGWNKAQLKCRTLELGTIQFWVFGLWHNLDWQQQKEAQLL